MFIIMASQINFAEILEERFPSYKAEVTAFLDTLHISQSTDVSIEINLRCHSS